VVKVEFAAQSTEAVVIGVLEEGVEVEVFQSSFVAEAETKIERGLGRLALFLQEGSQVVLTSVPSSVLPNGGSMDCCTVCG
jgi:hypothetical protein